MKCSERRARGFTLVELMVAMVAGMFVAIAVFTLAKHSSAFSMRQSRIADATLQSVVGFERLKADISRAGFLSTPNLSSDRAMCRDSGDPLYPPAMRSLASVMIEDSPNASDEMTVNGLAPRRIVLAGSYSSADQFPARNIIDGPPPQVFLVPNSLGMVNIGYPAAQTAATLARVFATGRALRIVDDVGRVQFAQIAAVTGGANPSITLAASPRLEFRSGNSLQCGIRGHGKNLVNVVNIIRYDVRDLSGTAGFGHMFSGGPTYEATRRELVREELDHDGDPFDGTLELIAEYAVDLGFSLWAADNTTGPMTRLRDDDVTEYAGDTSATGSTATPQRIRAVHAWLSVRSQEADRTTDLSLASAAPGPQLMRVSMHPTDSSLPPFARVRTLQSTIPLPNQARATW
jgi:prepilin-type N-terminal cleavage/methylation domain-containing protein